MRPLSPSGKRKHAEHVAQRRIYLTGEPCSLDKERGFLKRQRTLIPLPDKVVTVAKSKPIEIDILDMEMSCGLQHWLDPVERYKRTLDKALRRSTKLTWPSCRPS
jgi:hypothetical protein